MGGLGSGLSQRGKDTTVGFNALDVRRLQRDGLLAQGSTCCCNWVGGGETVAAIRVEVEAEQLMLEYQQCSNGGDWQSMKYGIKLERTGCNYGGSRAWFLCPAEKCGRRVALLYLGSAGIFACRHCYRLAYVSQRKNAGSRAKLQAEKIRSRLGWLGSIANGEGDKPKGMRWRTFQRLAEAHDNFVNVAESYAVRKYKRRLGL